MADRQAKRVLKTGLKGQCHWRGVSKGSNSKESPGASLLGAL